MNKQVILVTGANGFVGQALCRILLENNFKVRAVVRSTEKAILLKRALPSINMECIVADFAQNTDWNAVFYSVDVVVHLAARVHIMEDSSVHSLAEYHRSNTLLTERLAEAAAVAKVKRFIYLSSIKVNGENNKNYVDGSFIPFTEKDVICPLDPYARSKWGAELRLQKINQSSSLETVIIRPPLIYGYGVKANFLSLVNAVKRGIPLPLATVNNQRSLIYVENLVDAIITCIEHAKAANQTFIVSDGKAVSTPELIKQIATVLKKSPRLWPFPRAIMEYFAKWLGKEAAIERLWGSLVVDCSKIQHELNWQPPYTLPEALLRDFGDKTTA